MKATTKKTTQATAKAIQPNNLRFTVTFGTLLFSIDHDGNSQLVQQALKAPNPQVQQAPALNATQTQENTRGKFRRQGLNTKHTVTAQRFIKARPATTEWQTVQRKTNHSKIKNRSKECFFCHKEGHIRKFCWQRIKCFQCGKHGHKAAQCLYKPRQVAVITPPKQPASKLQPTTTPNTTSKPKVEATPNRNNPHMDLDQLRPPLGDIFCPPRQHLNDENYYLATVGLIILIRGTPSPNLPQLIATKMVQLHGGDLDDYSITQATITPYLITCRTEQIRDSVVQRGIYTIPEAQVQFTVHEWRPRFGMGHDPSTHQVWVQIIGLPLQAWTESEILAVLRHFGHPLQIMPFGREAGHFRDITALVATKHPSHIPFTYVYREGDYSTRVDILIMSWRP